MLSRYSRLKADLDAKNRGRKHSIQVVKAPELWATLWGDDILITLEDGGCVGVLKPDNSLTVQWGHWHTQLTCRIISELTGSSGRLYSGWIWYQCLPAEGGELHFNEFGEYIKPKKYVELSGKAYHRLQQVVLPPEVRLRLEIGEWQPMVRVTQRVKDYALGKITLDKLTPAEMVTCVGAQDRVVQRLLEEAA